MGALQRQGGELVTARSSFQGSPNCFSLTGDSFAESAEGWCIFRFRDGRDPNSENWYPLIHTIRHTRRECLAFFGEKIYRKFDEVGTIACRPVTVNPLTRE